ncbi:Hypothetical protein CINCED_3A002536 [Cinara cedri]|uniref:Uncharacterized protein n=1 Tax=Cinara cedri TaxID=506608 RepID=A0A5E4N3G4_9HEMI|nr:Hypothetical protein CINCED_3A002536 [Cinara cedri]
MCARHAVFGLLALVVLAPATSAADRPPSRLDLRDVLNQLRGAPDIVAVGPAGKADRAVKSYLDKLQARYAAVLDRPWDARYASHTNVRRWKKS